MPRFFFHLHDVSGLVPDEEGREFGSIDSARAHALQGIRSIISDDAKSGTIDVTLTLEVADESGVSLFTLGFDEAIQMRAGEQRGQ